MRSKIGMLCLVLFMTQSCFPVAHVSYTGPRVDYAVRNAYSVSVKLLLRDITGKVMGRASGVVLQWEKNKTVKILTCKHVVAGANKYGLFIQAQAGGNSTKILMMPSTISPKHDLAILQSILPATYYRPSIRLSSRVGLLGQEVYIIGNPNNDGPSIGKGIISYIGEYKGSVVYYSDSLISQGSSGGGVFNTQQELLGITFGMITYGPIPFLAAPNGTTIVGLESIVEFLYGSRKTIN